MATQVKGRTYRLSELVGEPLDFSRSWQVGVFYLSPKDYHRFHFPAAAHLVAARRDGGRLYPVNALALPRISDLFIRNERVTLKCRTGDSVWYLVAVGATFVGGITTVAGEIAAAGGWFPVGCDVTQLAEAGRFNFGSTIVLVLPEALAGDLLVSPGTPVRVGDPVWVRRVTAPEGS